VLHVHSAALLAGDCPGNPLRDGEALILIASVANLSAGLSRHPVHHVAALLPGHGAALLPGHEVALLLVNITRPGHRLALANLVGNLLALLTSLLDVIADLSGNLVADLPGGCGALLLSDIRGLGPGHSGAGLAGHRATLLPGLLAARLGVSVSGADLLVPCLALLLLHRPALLLLHSLRHRLLDVLAVGLGDIVALLVVLSPAFLPGVIHSAAALRILGPALLLVISLLDRLGDSPALLVLNIPTTLFSDIATFLTCDLLVRCLLLLVAILDRLLGALLGAHRLIDRLLDIPTLLLRDAATSLLGVTRLLVPELGAAEEAELEELLVDELVGDTGERQEKARNDKKLHLEDT